jgi:tetratricopeptide (TPR) repeat protein
VIELHSHDETAVDAVIEAYLDDGLSAAFGPGTDPWRTRSFATPPPPTTVFQEPVRLRGPDGEAPTSVPARAGRYPVAGEIARGGTGAVLRARDPDLGRDLAIKVLLEAHQDNPQMQRRFVEEAQVGGQLQHPGVVPVHELGRFDDGRLYFTMKLVRGHTLHALLGERPSPRQDLGRFLAVFEQVCQTVAYAHSRGVIHRDLKPGNVMVGAFGEVQVMDWGLAKVLAGAAEEPPAAGPATAEGGIQTVRSGCTAADSHAGAVVGTPAYMPPEQAGGRLWQTDERSDVFGLGGILCQILTGQPPYVGPGGRELCRLAESGDLAAAFARLDGCGADPELVRLAKECLAPEPADRPRDAAAVARLVSAYREGVQERLRQAEVARAVAEERARAERRRRRRSEGLAGGGALVLMLLVTGNWAWQSSPSRRGLDAPPPGGGEAARAAEAEGHARAALALARADLGSFLQRKGRLGEAIEFYGLVLSLDPRQAEAHTNLGAALLDRGQPDEALCCQHRALELEPRNARALTNLGSALAAEGKFPDAEAAWRQAVALQPDRPEAHNNLGIALESQGKAAEAVAAFRAAIRLKPDLAEAHTNLGVALRDQGDLAGAVAACREALRLKPDYADAHNNLGAVLRAQGKVTEAVAAYREALRLKPDSTAAHFNLGAALADQGRVAEAVAAYQEAFRLKSDFPEATYDLGAALRD